MASMNEGERVALFKDILQIDGRRRVEIPECCHGGVSHPPKGQPCHEGHVRSDQGRDRSIHGTDCSSPESAVESGTELVDGIRGKDMRLANLRKVVISVILRRPEPDIRGATKPSRRL